MLNLLPNIACWKWRTNRSSTVSTPVCLSLKNKPWIPSSHQTLNIGLKASFLPYLEHRIRRSPTNAAMRKPAATTRLPLSSQSHNTVGTSFLHSTSKSPQVSWWVPEKANSAFHFKHVQFSSVCPLPLGVLTTFLIMLFLETGFGNRRHSWSGSRKSVDVRFLIIQHCKSQDFKSIVMLLDNSVQDNAVKKFPARLFLRYISISV